MGTHETGCWLEQWVECAKEILSTAISTHGHVRLACEGLRSSCFSPLSLGLAEKLNRQLSSLLHPANHTDVLHSLSPRQARVFLLLPSILLLLLLLLLSVCLSRGCFFSSLFLFFFVSSFHFFIFCCCFFFIISSTFCLSVFLYSFFSFSSFFFFFFFFLFFVFLSFFLSFSVFALI